ncbi:YqgE/AlgH family protein [Paracoccus sp. (in: a-proteobacteria)]|uniref:YqgE/AlgH family protein n=1 Tax=Paracoccus sp. TaxID=267 RepID=UPI0026DF3330|nr:YqgE/AlgH family protein [Paracoccus sp. (in: a-proteobacteria)]MDO5370821.1 YqgE/AlgH family protein [Paracoccus sp. (in: a-proteobacteria)]
MTRSDDSADSRGHRPDNLTGKVLIAMPGMTDPRFAHSVVLICAHGDEGAMGIVLNKPLPGIGFSDLLGQLGIDSKGTAPAVPVHFGGPVEPGRGFVLHPLPADDSEDEGMLRIGGLRLGLTTTRNILEDIASGRGPDRAVLSLGYAGWDAGQLETEMMANGWLTAEAGDDLIFGTDNAQKWQAALRSLGVDPLALSTAAGHA